MRDLPARTRRREPDRRAITGDRKAIRGGGYQRWLRACGSIPAFRLPPAHHRQRARRRLSLCEEPEVVSKLAFRVSSGARPISASQLSVTLSDRRATRLARVVAAAARGGATGATPAARSCWHQENLERLGHRAAVRAWCTTWACSLRRLREQYRDRLPLQMSRRCCARADANNSQRVADLLARRTAAVLDRARRQRGGAQAQAQLRLSDDLVTAVLVPAARRRSRPASASVPHTRTGRCLRWIDASLVRARSSRSSSRCTRRPWIASFEVSARWKRSSRSRLFVLTLGGRDRHRYASFIRAWSATDASALARWGRSICLAAFQSPEANDIVSFSLEILPSVLETKTRRVGRHRRRRSATAASAPAARSTRMVLSELAWDDAELARRIADNELLYYAREQSRDEQRRVHVPAGGCLSVDARRSPDVRAW